MFFLSSESESSAGFAVSQDFIQPEQPCQTVQVNSITMQVKNLRYSRLKTCVTPSGYPRPWKLGNHQASSQNHAARKELKPFWMQFKKDEANDEISNHEWGNDRL
jgi:hypothetical protein